MFKVEVTYGSDRIAQAALNRRVHDRLIEEVFNGRNLEVLDEILHPDFVNHHELFPNQGPQGPGVYRELYADFFRAFPNVQSEYHAEVAEGGLIIAHNTMRGTNTGPMGPNPPTCRKVEFKVFHLYRFRDGKIVDRWGPSDDLTMTRQLGLLPSSKR
jgi:predicted ester cyclase